MALGAGLQLCGLKAGIGFGHREAGFFLAGDDRRQHAALLLLGAVDHDRVEAEDVHVHGGSAGKSGAGRGDSMHHHRGFADAEPGAAISFRDTNAEPAVCRQRAVEVVGKFAVVIALEPIIITEARADLLDGVAHRLLKF